MNTPKQTQKNRLPTMIQSINNHIPIPLTRLNRIRPRLPGNLHRARHIAEPVRAAVDARCSFHSFAC